MGWKPDNWEDLDRAERKVLRREHRARTLGALEKMVIPLIKRAASELAVAGDEKHDWVVEQATEGLDKLITAPGPWGLALEASSDVFIRSDFVQGWISGVVEDAFDKLRTAGEV